VTDGPALTVVVPESGYRLLLEGLLFDADSERVIFAARLHPNGVELQGSEGSLEELAGYVAFEANHAETRPLQRRWDEVFDALQSAWRR
jgi:hypothetical protein